ncbi:cell wall hydrolase [Pseudovibrio exalbescens]|uniref:cell wall hydrolase n=1 Tax=Pseudovibrio exalbescens TaxID=197461 RepID=UPI002365F771|nr:cell wall hydrolase [Pseudovibrio exalbescens]MDD7911221.1 cell wall hydrolase [Pseudovibrio exalbescens]
MSGPIHSKRARKRSTWKKGLAVSTLTTLVYCGSTLPVAQQDVLELVMAVEQQTPRWMRAIETANHATLVEPTLIGSANTATHAADYVLNSPASSGNGTHLPELASVLANDGTHDPSQGPRVNRSAKGDRGFAMAPARQPLQGSAGSIFALSSLLTGAARDTLPQVAFVSPEHLPANASSTMMAKNTRDGKPLDLTEMAIARNSAAASLSLASAYAPSSTEALRAPFDALLGGTASAAGKTQLSEEELQELAKTNPHWWYKAPLPESVHSSKEKLCLAEAIYFEARGEPYKGQEAVAQVVLNRVKNPAYPNTICKVVYQNRHMRNACQFSFACDGIPERVQKGRAWTQSQEIAEKAVNGEVNLSEVDASTHYHATYVRPRWAGTMKKLNRIGKHIFYKTYGGGWS